MVNSTVSNLNIYYSVEQQHSNNYLPHCILKWRQGQLFVSLGNQDKQPYISAFESEQQVVECLKQSPVRLVRLDLNLGEAVLNRWADACEKANKSIFIRGSVAQKLSRVTRRQSKFRQQLQQLIYWIVAFLLLIVQSPVMLATAILIYIYSPGAIFSRQWHIGSRGKLFRLLKFRTTVVNDDVRSAWLFRLMCKYNVDKLPQLLNVLRGEISLIDSHPLSLAEATLFSWEDQPQLIMLLEMAEAQIQGNNSNEFDGVPEQG